MSSHQLELPDVAYGAALASVPSLGPRGLRAVLDEAPPPAAWEAVCTGRAPLGRRTARAAREAQGLHVRDVWQRHVHAGIGIALRGTGSYPAVLADDPEAPAVLFSLGDATVLDRFPRVAMVGTRSATRYGLGVASELGAALAGVGICVVSGLALGIDGAAHEGALGGTDGERTGAPPVAVVAGGLSTPYPQRHARLWQRVEQAGAVISEAPMGAADLTWRFPQRNRIIAAVAEVVVVVECHSSGGSLHTVEAAVRRSIPVTAVPGSIRSPASAGTNGLLADGCAVIRDVTDVLVALGLRRVGLTTVTEPRALPLLDPTASAVLDAVGWERCTIEVLLTRTGLAIDECAAALERLAQHGVLSGSGGWWERV